jgi:hypothetical protein
MPSITSNHWKYHLLDKINGDTFKLILMAAGFSFSRADHATYADVSASELANIYGYTTGGQPLTGLAIEESDLTNKAVASFNDAVWTADGGSIGPSPGAIVYDDSASDKVVVGYIDFIVERTATDGNDFNIQNIKIEVN